MKTSCIQHPADEPLIVLHQWQSDAFEDALTGALLSYFEYWHNIKTGMLGQAEHFNKMAQLNGVEANQDTTVLQYHTQAEIETHMLRVGKKTKIKGAIKRLVEAEILSIQKNPDPRYKFDRTNYYQFHPETVNAFLEARTLEKSDWSKTANGEDTFVYSWAKYDQWRAKYDQSGVKNGQTITEINSIDSSIDSSEKSTASADAPSSSNQGSKKKAPPKILTKKMTQRLVDVYQELKPARWGDVKVLNDKRIGMADRAYQACGQDIEATIQIVRDALRYVSTQEWWTSKRFTFGTLFERGDGGQGDYRFIRWSELSTSKPESVDASDTPELTVMQRIGRQLKRLDRSGRLPHDWERETGCALASDLSESQQQQYLEELLQEPDPPAKPDFTGPPRQIHIPIPGQARRSA